MPMLTGVLTRDCGDDAGGAMNAARAAELFTAAMAAESDAEAVDDAAMGSGTGFMPTTMFVVALAPAPPAPPFLALRAASRKPARYIRLSSSRCSSGKFDNDGREMFDTDSPGLRGHATDSRDPLAGAPQEAEVTLSGLIPPVGTGTPSTIAPLVPLSPPRPALALLWSRLARRSISSIPLAMSSSSSSSWSSSSMSPPDAPP